MNFKSIVRRLRNKSLILQLAWNQYRLIRWKWLLKVHDDYKFICKAYQKSCGRNVNLVNPERFTEKLQWLKLFYRDQLIPICSDKYEVRSYLARKGYDYLLNELIAVHETVDDIDFSKLPDKFVIKASHGSGWNLMVKDKNKVNWFMWKRIMKSWLKQNLYWFGREWNYDFQKPRLVIERYLEDDSGELRDYKFFCFDGKVEFMQFDENRFSTHKRCYVDRDCNFLSMRDTISNISKPSINEEQFKSMRKLAEELSTPFPHVRVDFYCCNGKIYFGEFTFFDGSGFYTFNPDSWDIHWGAKLNLPEPNYNLELYQKITNKDDKSSISH